MKIIFAGTPGFVLPVLRSLCACGHQVAGVITPPDRPAGRGRRLTSPPVKDEAVRLNIEVHQTSDINGRHSMQWIRTINPDAMVVAAFGQFLAAGLLGLPRYGCLNVHLSLLPKYRGAAPVAWAILNGENQTGVSIIKLVRKMDAGPIILQRGLEILPDETTGELQDRLGMLGGQAIADALELLFSGKAEFQAQDESLATFAPALNKEDGLVDWKMPAWKIFKLVRAMNPWPLAYTFYPHGAKGLTRIIINRVKIIPEKTCANPGEVIDINDEGPVVATGEGAVILKELKPAGSRVMTGAEYSRGHALHKGGKFGDING